MIEFVIGPARSGKTVRCYQEIKEALKEDAYHALIVLVPEQFNLQVQVELAERLHPGLLRVEVLSFKNLAQRVLKEVGGLKEPLIDDLERVMILKKLLEAHKNELSYFKKGYSNEGFIDGMNRLITIFEQNAITKESLDDLRAQESVGEVFKCKLEDMNKVQGWFEAYIQEKFVTVEKTMERLAGSLQKSTFLEGAVVWVDGFYGFTLPQMEILMQLMEKAQKMVITLPMDKWYTKEEYIFPNNPFYDSIRNLQRFQQLCEERHIAYKLHTQQAEDADALPAPLGYLNQNYLKTYVKPYPSPQDQVVTSAYSSREEEIEQTARQIQSLIRDKGYRYKDIAVLVGDLNMYQSSLVSLFKEYQIPLFLDNKRSIHTNSLVAVILGVLEVLTSSWRYKGMMSLLKLYMFDFTKEEVDLLDNYVLAFGIQGEKKWREEWEREGVGFDLAVMNRLREKVVNLIGGVKTMIDAKKNPNGHLKIKDATLAVYTFLENIGAYETIEKRIAYYQANGEGALEQENTQIWGQVVDTLDRLVDILGDEKVSLSVYKNILKTSFTYIKMGIIPPSKDQVVVGNIDRTRLPHIKAIFVLGVNEGVIPKIDDSMNLFSEMDKLTLTQLPKGQKAERLTDVLVNQPLFSRQFLIYQALTRATEKLVMSTVQRDESGKVIRPSMVYYKLKKLFGTGLEVGDPLACVQGPMPTMSYIGTKLRSFLEASEEDTVDAIWQDTLSWYMKEPVWRERVMALAKDFTYTNQQHFLKAEHAEKLYPNGLETSISRLESYRQCPCCYFIKYGLKASERRLFEWNAADLGTLFHATLEQYPRELQERQTTWTGATEVQRKESVEAAVLKSVQGTPYALRQDGRMRYTIDKVTKMTQRAVRALTYQLEQGEFEPFAYEVNFGYEGMPPIQIDIDDEHTILLKGQIDRVDVYVKDTQETYVKILDYKSGSTQFNLLEVYHCLQLQLLLYLDAYLRLNPAFKPAGMFYFHINSKNVKYELGMGEEMIAQKQLKQFKLSEIGRAHV